MAKLLFFRFRVTINLKLKNKKIRFELLTCWVDFNFFTFELTNVKLINEKKFLNIKGWIYMNP